MKLDLTTVNREQFYVRPGFIGTTEVVLIEPHGVGVAKWDKDNLIQRASIWTAGEGELVSAGFPKFFNWDEDQNKEGVHVPGKLPFAKPASVKGMTFLDKKDGSLAILSRFKGVTFLRTRGTLNAETLDNGYEVEWLRDKYPKAFGEMEIMQDAEGTCDFSLLFEWYSPVNKIVLNYGTEPLLWLIGGIYHKDYSLYTQDALDIISSLIDVPRPERYVFESIEDMKATVAALEGKEGVCGYTEDGQRIWKVKSLRYLSLHYYKGDVSTVDKLVDIWINQGYPKYDEFYNYLSVKYDWEIAEYAKSGMSRICDAKAEVERIIAGMRNFIANQLQGIPRKDAFAKVSASYGGKDNNRAGMVMNLYSGKDLGPEQYKKLVMQCMK